MNDAPAVRARHEDGLEVLRVVLPESPAVTWTIAFVFIDGTPHAQRLDYRASDPTMPVAMPITGGIPWARLIGVWCLWHGIHRDGTPLGHQMDLWGVLEGKPRHLPRRPQQTKTMSDDDYRERMADWSEPVAEVILAASTLGDSVRRAVARRFYVGEDRAKQLIELARTYHPYAAQASRPSGTKTDKRPKREKG